MSVETIVIVDYGLGNLFSVQRALQKIGVENPIISNGKEAIQAADRLILPGVGAFGDGMSNLRDLGIIPAIKDFAASGRPILGVCLGMQLIMSRSEEFGLHEGLDLLQGEVRLLQPGAEHSFKVPHIGWNLLHIPDGKMNAEQQWEGTVLRGFVKSPYMYFIHSYVVAPEDPSIIIAETRYGDDTYCSVFQSGNITGAQFHPELSAVDGLSIYRSFVHDN